MRSCKTCIKLAYKVAVKIETVSEQIVESKLIIQLKTFIQFNVFHWQTSRHIHIKLRTENAANAAGTRIICNQLRTIDLHSLDMARVAPASERTRYAVLRQYRPVFERTGAGILDRPLSRRRGETTDAKSRQFDCVLSDALESVLARLDNVDCGLEGDDPVPEPAKITFERSRFPLECTQAVVKSLTSSSGTLVCDTSRLTRSTICVSFVPESSVSLICCSNIATASDVLLLGDVLVDVQAEPVALGVRFRPVIVRSAASEARTGELRVNGAGAAAPFPVALNVCDVSDGRFLFDRPLQVFVSFADCSALFTVEPASAVGLRVTDLAMDGLRSP